MKVGGPARLVVSILGFFAEALALEPDGGEGVAQGRGGQAGRVSNGYGCASRVAPVVLRIAIGEGRVG